LQKKNHEYFTLLAKPTYACNMKCPKCYLELEREKKKGIMTDEVLTALISKACNLKAKYISIQWIGGESLLVGIDFYKKAAELISYYSKQDTYMDQCIQTNASLINDDWIAFLKEYPNIFLSISFEVTRELQEKLRPMSKDQSSYDSVKQSIQLLNKNNIPYGVLTVITKETLDINPKEWISHVIDLGIKSIGLQICYQDFYWGDLEDTKKCMDWIDQLFNEQSDYNQYANTIYDCLIIRESYYLYNIMRNLSICSCSCHNSISACSQYLMTVDVDGDIYGFCDAFMGTNDPANNFFLGNVVRDEFSSIVSSKAYNDIQKFMTNERKVCEDCDIYNLCHGGCPLFRSKNIKDGILIPSKNQSNYCKIQNSLFKYIFNITKRPLLRKIYHFLEEYETLPNSFTFK